MDREMNLMKQNRTLREKGRQFKVGDECWFDPDTINKNGDYEWVTVDWIVGRGPEWVVDGVYASCRIDHAPDFFEFDQLIPLCRS